MPRASYTSLIMLFELWISIYVLLAQAHSHPRRALNTIEHPRTLTLEILPRHVQRRDVPSSSRLPALDSPNLHHTDHFRLTLSAFSQTFYLHLRPNDDLIHPAARINYYSTPVNGGPSRLESTVALLRHTVLAYHGEVVHADHSDGRMREDAAFLSRPPHAPGTLGWARILVHHQGDAIQDVEPLFEGAFSLNGDVYHIMVKEKYMKMKLPHDPHAVDPASNLVIFRDSDLSDDPTSHGAEPSTACGHDHLPYNSDPSQHPFLRGAPLTPGAWWDNPWRIFEDEEALRGINRSRGKRDDVAGGAMSTNFVNSIGSTAGCPTTPKVLFMGVAADCQYTAQHGSVQNATSSILTNWNTASALYKSTFNVSLGIITLEVHEAACPSPSDSLRPWNVDCSSVTLNDRLSLFSTYRATLGDDGAGLWHLMSGCPTGTEVGVAWLGTLCHSDKSGQGDSIVSGTAVSTAGRGEWQVVAHEIGHNFGAIHDCSSGCNATTGCCPLSASTCDANSQFLMSPVTSAGEMNFSPCSIGNICSVMQAGATNAINTTCLQDSGSNTKTISLQMCGNGIVEQGEQCDPGAGANSTCCDPKTCKFVNNAQCDPSNDACCSKTCQIAPATQVCRPAIPGGCDIAETCSGTSAKCPSDSFKPNGQSCGSNGLACANGQCTSISQQCATVGKSLGLTTACPNKNTQTCQISCQNPQDSNSCVVLQSQLVDGSPCGYGGTCAQGNCQQGPLLDTVEAWYMQNLQISIPVTIVVGIVAILLLWSLIIMLKRCLCGSRNKNYPPPTAGLRGPAQRIPSWPAGQPPPQNEMHGNSFAPPPMETVMQPHEIPDHRLSIPPALRVGSVGVSQQRSRSPPVNASSNGRNVRPTRPGGPGSRRPPPGPIHTQWVDPTPWNGR